MTLKIHSLGGCQSPDREFRRFVWEGMHGKSEFIWGQAEFEIPGKHVEENRL